MFHTCRDHYSNVLSVTLDKEDVSVVLLNKNDESLFFSLDTSHTQSWSVECLSAIMNTLRFSR